MSKLKFILSIILTLAVLQGALLGFIRYSVEQSNNTVELVVDYADFKQASLSLQELKEVGITSIALLEQTPMEASANGELYFASGAGILNYRNLSPFLRSYANRGLISANKTYFLIKDPTVRIRVLDHLKATFSKQKIKFLGRNIIEVNENVEAVSTLGIGFSEKILKDLDLFRVVPRLANNPDYIISKKIALLKGLDTVVFGGEEILGYPDRLSELKDALNDNKIKYGYVEIIKQFGNSKLKKLMGNKIIRVHSISKDELKKTDPGVAVSRFIRATKERGIRMLYLRPYLAPNKVDNLVYFGAIADGIKKSGFKLGRASRPEKISLTKRPIIILGLGVMVGLIMLINAFIRLNLVATVSILIILTVGLFFAASQQMLAMMAAIIFPTIAVINNFSKPLPARNILWGASLIVMNVVAETSIGIILIIGLLSDSRFMLGSMSFVGVKLALLLPLLLITFYFLLKGEDKELDYKKLKQKTKYYLNLNIPLFRVLAGLFAVAILGILVARSGNFILPVLRAEKVFRSILENLLVVRPRFKEFLIGYPILFTSAILFLKGRRKWLWILLPIGALAPISLINTFCHIHTPLLISILRSLNGLILGIILGLIASFKLL